MIEPLTTLGLLSAFGTNIVAAAAFEWIAAKWKTAGVTNHDLQKALRESYCDALNSVEFGFRRREGLLDSLGKRRLYREITASFDKEFLTPFISETSLSEDELQSLAREGAKYCRILREAVDRLLPKEDVPNITIEDLLLTGHKLEGADDLRKLNEKAKADLMTKVRSVEGVPKFFFDFLDYKNLLMGSIVFFYGERIKADERVRSILTHAELQRIREEQSQRYQKQAAKLETALQSQMSAFQQFLSPIKDNFAEVLTCLERLEAEWAETTRYLQRILDLISLDKGLSDKDKRQLEAGLSPSFDLHAKYEFDERKPIGYGAVATVYRALHSGLRQVRAVKVLKPEHRENQEVVERFLREAVVLGSLKHANIVQIYDAGGGGPNLDFYLEMEYVEGVTLRNFIKTHEFDWQRILKFIKQLGSAIQTMHESGIIHRDLNPRNIMVDKNGDLKVMDFGVAKIVGVEGLTKDGQVVGTTDYIAPEQARGERVDERADIYSFGVILYELCTKRLPAAPPLPLRQYQLGIPEWLENIVEECLKQDKNLRYTSMKELLAAIEKQELEALKEVEIKEEPVLSVYPERLDFVDVKLESRSTKSLTLRNIGTGRLTGSITGTQPWIKVSPGTISLLEGEQKVLVTVDASGLVSGFKGAGGVNIATNGGTAEVAVKISMTMAAEPQRVPAPTTRRKKWLLPLIAGLVLLASLVIAFVIILPFGISGGPSKIGGGLPYEGKIAFDDGSNIYIINADGSNMKKLTENSTGAPEYEIFNNVAPAWSPDGTRIAFFSDRDYQEHNNLWQSDEIYVMNIDGSDQTRVTYDTIWGVFYPAWSPDGTKIVFLSDRDGNLEIYAVDLNTGDEKNLTNDPGADGGARGASWSPDGTRIAFSRYTNGNADVWIMNADGSNQRNLTNNPAEDDCPRWSPDGKNIFFWSNRDGTESIYIMNVDGSNQRSLTNDPNGEVYSVLSLSPDGKRIAFEFEPPGTAPLNTDICVMNANGTKLRNLTNNPHADNWNPTWAPDSKRIAFTSYRDGLRHIYIVNIDGSELQNLTRNLTYGGDAPAWAPK